MKNEKSEIHYFPTTLKIFSFCDFDSCEKCVHFLIVEKNMLVTVNFFEKKMKAVKKALMFGKCILIFKNFFWNIM